MDNQKKNSNRRRRTTKQEHNTACAGDYNMQTNTNTKDYTDIR
jgi:hypothetical protein